MVVLRVVGVVVVVYDKGCRGFGCRGCRGDGCRGGFGVGHVPLDLVKATPSMMVIVIMMVIKIMDDDLF